MEKQECQKNSLSLYKEINSYKTMTSTSFLKLFAAIVALMSASFGARAHEVARFTMQNVGDRITESVSGKTFAIQSVHPAENMPGAKGQALRFDGYSTHIDAELNNIIPAGSRQMTASVWLAVETYPIVEIDVNSPEQAAIVSCLDNGTKTGFGFFLGLDGKYSFKTFIGGWPLELKVNEPLARYEWVNLTAVIDADARTATLYNNGVAVATSKANGTLATGNSTLRIGRSIDSRFSGPFCVTSFNGLIDDIAVWDEAITPETIASWTPENPADMSIPAERFADDPMRPAFHAMPAANWANETHGMTYSNGRYHLFFQKNANGPYMSRLHWGHLSSENLCDWTEERIALAPATDWDMKGCWSGCVFADEELTGGKPSIIYTGVDYAKAVIAQANPLDDDLIAWEKAPVPVINGRPAGLSDDFRDPYFFRTGNGAYIIVGSSKGGIGTTTLHAYNPTSKSWSNDGKSFFSGSDARTCGTFWEMPNITKIGDKWLLTVTPQNTSHGVAALYWVGSINADGTFSPDKPTPSTIELAGLARDGYGLLSPTVYQRNGKTIAMGIVPDKLPSQANYKLGYAHTFSLPREWTLDSDGNLCQKPYAGLAELRADNGFAKSAFILDGSMAIDGVGNRNVELCGEFTVTSGKCGFTVLDDGVSALKIYYDGASNELVIDSRGVDRLNNDAGVFDGFYHSQLPRQLSKGEIIKLNVFFDHSILDIFINDTWATSVRVFANAIPVENVGVFADMPTAVHTLNAWNLKAGNSNAGLPESVAAADKLRLTVNKEGTITYGNVPAPAVLSVYNLSGEKMIEKNIDSNSGSIDTTLSGLHIVAINTPNGIVSRKMIF